MYIPQFIIQTQSHDKLNNLLLNCNTKDEFASWLFEVSLNSRETHKTKVDLQDLDKCVQSYVKPADYTYLSPYYFVPSKNDPENKLKALLTKFVKMS